MKKAGALLIIGQHVLLRILDEYYINKLGFFTRLLIFVCSMQLVLLFFFCLSIMTFLLLKKKQNEVIRLLDDSAIKNRILELKEEDSFYAGRIGPAGLVRMVKRMWAPHIMLFLLCYIVLKFWKNLFDHFDNLTEGGLRDLILRCAKACLPTSWFSLCRETFQLVKQKRDQVNRLLDDPVIRDRVLELKDKDDGYFAYLMEPMMPSTMLLLQISLSFLF
ncbi:unnamed protein product [Linum trigynum]|uniref:Uncharacterized protein n=1 Tax=Linum trigynum TaxID=586398 RepID=A0AAV2DMH9_9ROSI